MHPKSKYSELKLKNLSSYYCLEEVHDCSPNVAISKARLPMV